MATLGCALLMGACAPGPPTARTPGATDSGAHVVPVAPVDPDGAACDALCAGEHACPQANDADCLVRCRKDAARMKPGFVATFARCYAPALPCEGPSRAERHEACYQAAVATFGRDEENQRGMAEPVCARGERCMGLGELGRRACLEATLHPQEAELRQGQRLVDALRPARIRAFRRCVDEAPCARPDEPDEAVSDCYARTIVEGT